MSKVQTGLLYWFLSTCFCMVVILFIDIDYPLTSLLLRSIVFGYAIALILYNFKDLFRYWYRKYFSTTRKIDSSRIRKPKFKFHLIPDFS